MPLKDPLVLLLIPFCIILFYILDRKKEYPTFRYSSTKLIQKRRKSWKITASQGLILIRLMVFTLFIVALAGPRLTLERSEITTEGIDIILAVDASGSMAAEDFKIKNKRINRLSVVKNVVEDFVDQRSGDRIGLVVFAGQAYTLCPLTTDYDWLVTNLRRVELGVIGEDGTAIGSALVSSLGRLDESKAKSKIIILLTDGVNNAGNIQPLEAAKAATSQGIKIYTIGAGSRGVVPYPAQDLFGRKVYQQVQVDLDETTLKEIAQMTEGQYFRATDTQSLREIYAEIDKLEKTEIQETGYKEYKQLFGWFLLAALALFSLELILSNTILTRIP